MSAPLDPVAILAGGLATRMRPVTEKIPKSLLEVAGEPFIAHQLRYLASQGARHVVLCVGHLGEMIEERVGDGAAFGVNVQYSREGETLLGTGGALKQAIPLLGERFFVLYGDSYLPTDYGAVQNAFDQTDSPALMTVFENHGRWDGSNVLFEEGRILDYDKRNPSPSMRHIDYGLGMLRAEALTHLPDGLPADLAAVYRRLVEAGRLAAFEVHDRFYEIGSFQGWEETCRLLTHSKRSA